METRTDQARALLLTVLLHVAGLALFWLSASWAFAPRQEAASGEPISASLQLSSADVKRAREAIAEAAKAQEDAASKPQPLPSPRPQTSDTPLQPKPQAPQDQPDSVDQQAIDRNALLKAEQMAQEQKERRRQEQVDLTEEIERQQEVERRQQLARQQLEAIRREREAASQRTLMEEQRMRQLADRRSASTPTPNAPSAAAQSGSRGTDEGLRARYKAALNATARANWTTGLAPEKVRCKVSFTQREGGFVLRVDFIDCPYDERGRDSVERALLKSPMPYQGFESVFERIGNMEFCYPDEACN